jgi:hypothetical protein
MFNIFFSPPKIIFFLELKAKLQEFGVEIKHGTPGVPS